ncbi:MAG: methyltransferase domain-containing protein [Acidobacteria bacterium]|nr:methyltransferase domain-containing protein [Acidobacteriota bacterium]
MRTALLDLLRCPFCGGRLEVVENEALVRVEDRIESGVLGCDCCAFPIVAGIPVLVADDPTRDAMHRMEAGQHEDALFMLLGLDADRGASFRALVAPDRKATYREALALLSLDAEADCFLYRFSDPTYLPTAALLRAIGQNRWTVSGPVLDLCGGSGHLTRVLAGLQPSGGIVDADVCFWKLWLAKRFTVPACDPVCCDANSPLPFARETFSMALLADAFPYIWHKRLLAEEMMRLVGPDGLVVLPHLHSARGENVSAGMTLTPVRYRELFSPLQPRLFSDARLFRQLLDRRVVDLTEDASPDQIGTEPSLTLVATPRADLFRTYDAGDTDAVEGELTVNPLYRVARQGRASVLTLTFPTPEYEEEFGACKEYLPSTLTVDADLTGPIEPALLGADCAELRRRRVILDAPKDYS